MLSASGMQQPLAQLRGRSAHGHQAYARPHPRVRLPVRVRSASADVQQPALPPADNAQDPAGAPAAAAGSSACPFLASLPAPPNTPLNFWDRLSGIFNPPVFQKAMLGPSGSTPVVFMPSQPLMIESYMVGDGELGKAVLAGELEGTFTTAVGEFGKIKPLLGPTSILVVPEPRHSYLRGLMQPAFTPEAVSSALPRVERVLSGWMERWAEAEEPVKGYEELKAMTFDFILQAVFDRHWEPEEVLRLSNLFATYSAGFLGWPYMDIPFTPYARGLEARRRLVEELMVAVEEVRAELAGGAAPRGVMGALLTAQDEAGNKLTDQELADNLLVLLLAGHDTSSATLTLALANLQQHPAALDKLRAEQEAVLAKHGPGFTAGVLKEMVYADAVIRETLRRDNIVSAMSRRALQDVDLGGYRVPAGAMVQVPFTYFAQHDPRWAEATGELDPAAFYPERLMTKEGSKPGWLMPFGHGPRFCIGYNLAMVEMKVFLALLVRTYDFTADTDTEWTYAIGKIPKNGLPLTLTRRAAA